MRNVVKLSRHQLDRFRRLARQSHLEIQAYLTGHVVSPNLTVVDKFVYPSEYGIQTQYQAAWFRREYEKAREMAEAEGARIVGSIHSHPNMDDAVISTQDYESCITEGHRICGIVTTFGNKSRVRFWVMDCALPAELVYAKGEGTPKSPQGSGKGCTPNAQQGAPDRVHPDGNRRHRRDSKERL